MDGWIKLHRKILDNPIVCKDSDHIAVWTYLLLNATHKEYASVFKGIKIILQPGQLITGRKTIAEKFKISESKVQRILKSFENEQQIEQQNGNKNRLISILSWLDYQSSEQQDEQQLNNKRTSTEQQVNTNKNVKNLENLKNDKEITTTTVTDDSELSVMDAYEIAFNSLNMTGLISGYIHEIRQKGCDDSFIRELFLETGESSTKPNLKLLRAIGDSWLEKGIRSRQQSKEAKQKRISANGAGRSGNSSYSNQPRKQQIEIYKEPEHLDLPSDEEYQKMLEKARQIRDAKSNKTA